MAMETKDAPALRDPVNEWLGVPTEEELTTCVRCGICLPHCPTYRELGVETASPRGRAALIKAAAEGRLPSLGGLSKHMYLCLNDQACHTVCPSGVRVGEMVELARAELRQRCPPPLLPRLIRRAILGFALGRHSRLEALTRPLYLYEKSGLKWLVNKTRFMSLLPLSLRRMEDYLPPLPGGPLRPKLPEVIPPRGEKRARVGFFLGCVMNLFFTPASRATLEVLSANGCEVFIPKEQRCCGAPHANEGERELAQEFARFNVELFENHELDAIVTDCAACGADLKNYRILLASDPSLRERAKAFSHKVEDVHRFLRRLPPRAPERELKLKVTYHDACHLIHSQGIHREPRELLKSVPGLEFVELPESDWCCGSAGTYAFTHTDISSCLQKRKMENIAATGADAVLAGNPGCLLQLEQGRRKYRVSVRVMHPMELLAEVYRAGD